MREDTIRRKEASRVFQEIGGRGWLLGRMGEIISEGKQGLDRLVLSKRMVLITDGGGGIIKALKERLGSGLIHQRCTVHKDRNIQRHLAKRWRKEAHRRFRAALEQNS